METTDTTSGTGGIDTIEGNEGDDLILGGVGGDTIHGNDGNDVIVGDNGTITGVTCGGGVLLVMDDLISEVSTLGGNDVIYGNAGNDVIVGGCGADTVYGGNSAAGSGVSGSDADLIVGDNGHLEAVQFQADWKVALIETTDTDDITGGIDTIEGNEGDDLILGGVGGDTIHAGEGNNIVLGDSGRIDSVLSDGDASDIDLIESTSTTLYGGVDTITTGDGNDLVIGGRYGDTINAGGGNNLVIGDSGRITAASVDTAPDQEERHEQLAGIPMTFGLIETLTSADGGVDTITTGVGNDIILGGAAGDTITAGAGTNLVLGDNGKLDYVVNDGDPVDFDLVASVDEGIGGNDTITAGDGSDLVVGGTGADTITVNNGDNLVLGDSGQITAAATDGPQLAGLALTLGLVETTVFGDGGVDSITTLGGNDIVLGGHDADLINAGEGNNIVLGDDGQIDYVRAERQSTEVGADLNPADIDLIQSTSTQAAGGADQITAGVGNDIVIGGRFGDTINAGAGSNVVLGDSGVIVAAANDTPRFGDQQITVIALGSITSSAPGDGGDDTITTFGGDDIIIGGAEADTVRAGDGADIVLGDNGVINMTTDKPTPVVVTVSSTDYNIGGKDRIYGEGGDDVLIGGAADDLLDGGSGRDLILGDNAKLDRSTTLENFTNPRFRTLAGTQIYDASGGVLVDGQAQNDPRGNPVWGDFQITMLDTSSTAYGSEYIAGGAGDDAIFGGLGNDTVQGDGSIDFSSTGNYAAIGMRVGAVRDGSNALLLNPSFDGAGDGDDYIEGGGGNDVIFGNQGQDDIIGGSSNLFNSSTPAQRSDGSDLIFGGSGTVIARNTDGDTTTAGHANDSDVIVGDNGNIYRIVKVVNTVSQFDTFGYDSYSSTMKIVVRAVELVDYTLGGPDFTSSPTDDDTGTADGDIGAADEIHGESGDDFIYGQVGDDVLFGEGQDDDLIGGYGNDWISGGTGDDGVLGDDGRIYTSRNSTGGEPLYGIEGLLDRDPNARVNNGCAQ